jgi:hypothetical protein
VPELPHLPHAPGNYDPSYARLFYIRNRRSYPPHIQQMIDGLPASDAARRVSRTAVEDIDRAIRQEHTNLANAMAGYGKSAQKPFVNSVRGASNEGGRFSSAVTDEKNLSLHGQLKSQSGIAEFDAIGFRGKAITETKMNLRMKTEEDIYDQMRRQAVFAKDWKFTEVNWEVWTDEGAKMAERMLASLRHNRPELGAMITVRNPNNAGHVIDLE